MSSDNYMALNAPPFLFPFDLNELPDLELEANGINTNSVLEACEEVEDPITDLTVDLYNDDQEHDPTSNPNEKQGLQFLSNEQRIQVYNALLERSVNGKLKQKTTTEVAALLSVPIRTVQRIWKQTKESPTGVAANVCHRKTRRVGRKRTEVDLSLLSFIPLRRTRTLRSLSQALCVSYGCLFRCFKNGLIRRHSNAIKPHLKDQNKISRLQFCLSMLDRSSLPYEPKFVDMYNTIHIDEKWFYMTEQSKTYYLSPEEDDPLRTCQSKNFIVKVIFLAAIARPRYDEDGNETFSGKIGMFSLVTKQPAIRRSRNREAGTLQTKPILPVTKDTIRSFLIEKILPAIEAMWPIEDSRKTIFIQQDNARTHVSPDDAAFQAAAAKNGFDIRLTYQPPNSPDLNVLDLGSFSSIHSLQDKECSTIVDGLIHAVEKSFQEYPASKINRIFLTLESYMKEIMRVDGSNCYKIPHCGKDRLERNGMLPKQIYCEYPLVESD